LTTEHFAELVNTPTHFNKFIAAQFQIYSHFGELALLGVLAFVAEIEDLNTENIGADGEGGTHSHLGELNINIVFIGLP
jgi:hypothetical protein